MKIVRNHFILLLLALLFLTPGLSAYFFYYHADWLGGKKTNKGELLKPALFISSANRDSKWRLILWSPTTCETSCLQALDQLARVRLALGRRLYEVEIDLLLGKEAQQLPKQDLQILQERDIRLVRFSAKEYFKFPEQSKIFIANPDNYLVLAYQSTVKPDDVFHDIKHLLKTKE